MTEMYPFYDLENTQVLGLSDPCYQEKLDYAAAEGQNLDGWKQETLFLNSNASPRTFSSRCSPGWQKHSLPTVLCSLGQSFGRKGRTREPPACKRFGLNVTPLNSQGHCPALITCISWAAVDYDAPVCSEESGSGYWRPETSLPRYIRLLNKMRLLPRILPKCFTLTIKYQGHNRMARWPNFLISYMIGKNIIYLFLSLCFCC